MKKIFTLAVMTVMAVSANALSFTIVSNNNSAKVVLSTNDARPTVHHSTVVEPAPRAKVVKVKPEPPRVKHHAKHHAHKHAQAVTWRDAAKPHRR